MRHLARIIALLCIILTSLFAARPVLAFPPLPSSFYGTVKVNAANVPDGTLIKSLINGQVYAEEQTQTYQGDSVYALDIPGDNPDTTVVEGGRDGDRIVFIIGGTLADQTESWKSGTTVSLNLSTVTSATMNAPQDTLNPMPTQTAIIIGNQPSASATTKAQSIPTTGVLMQGSLLPTALLQPTPKIPAVTNLENDPANSSQTIMVIGIVLVGFILFTTLWLIFVRKPKV